MCCSHRHRPIHPLLVCSAAAGGVLLHAHTYCSAAQSASLSACSYMAGTNFWGTDRSTGVSACLILVTPHPLATPPCHIPLPHSLATPPCHTPLPHLLATSPCYIPLPHPLATPPCHTPLPHSVLDTTCACNAITNLE